MTHKRQISSALDTGRRLADLADLAGVGDLAAEYGVGKAAISNWIKRYPDFPIPLVTLSCGNVYSRRQVREWHSRHNVL